MEAVSEDASRYLLTAQIKGRNAITEMPVDGSYEVIEPLTANDLLVKDSDGVSLSSWTVPRKSDYRQPDSH